MKIVNLNSDEPDPPSDGKWVLIEQDSAGLFYGTGFGARDGEQKIYISESENDISLDAALAAARAWAEKSDVEVIYVKKCAEH